MFLSVKNALRENTSIQTQHLSGPSPVLVSLFLKFEIIALNRAHFSLNYCWEEHLDKNFIIIPNSKESDEEKYTESEEKYLLSRISLYHDF